MPPNQPPTTPPNPQSAPTSAPNSAPSPATTSTDNTTDPENPTREAITAFTASLHSLGANYTSELVDRAKTLHGNSAALRKQEEQLARTTEELRRQNAEWEGVTDEARDGLKEIGDVQNWAEMIERDLLVVEDVVAALEAEDFGDLDGDFEGGRSELEEERGGDDGEGDEVIRGVEDINIGDRRLNGNGNANANGNGKVDGEDGKGKGKGKKPTEKKGWFSWW